jgi:DNA-binding CsgD family transcriptional regulator
MISLSHREAAAPPFLAATVASGRAPTEAMTRSRLREVAQRHSFAGGAYMHLGRNEDAYAAGPRRLVAVGDLDEQAYRLRGYLADDPLARRASQAFLPFVWTLDEFPDTAATGPVLSALRRWGVTAGVVAPVQDYATGPAFLNLFAARAETLMIDPGLLMRDALQLHADLRGRDNGWDVDAPAVDLTGREAEVLRLAALGCTEPETALALGLSRRGVQFHLTRAMAKLDAPNKTAAVARAVALGLIEIRGRRDEEMAGDD